MRIIITIFTPAFNRAHLLINLYNSLLKQTANSFEWLIVDDGSTDNTEELVLSFIDEQKIPVRYFRQENGGKHRAINRGVKEAKGELFFIVDSDDYVADNAVERILFHYNNIKDNSEFAGVCGCRAYFSGKKVGGEANFEILYCSSLDFRHKYKMKGDMAEVFKTEILRQYPFPEIEGERFCPEALIWNRIAKKYKLLYFNENIYFCEYLPDGLTAKIVEVRQKSPITSMLYYSELYKSEIPLMQKFIAAIHFWRFALCSKIGFFETLKKIGVISLLAYPFGLLAYIVDSGH